MSSLSLLHEYRFFLFLLHVLDPLLMSLLYLIDDDLGAVFPRRDTPELALLVVFNELKALYLHHDMELLLFSDVLCF